MSKKNAPAISDLVRRLLARDESVVQDLIDLYLASLIVYIFRKIKSVGSHDEAESLALHALTEAWYKIDKYDPGKGTLTQWLYGIAGHEAGTFIRVRKRQEALERRLVSELALIKVQTCPESALVSKQFWNSVEDGLSRLNKRDRKIFLLRYAEGRRVKDIAAQMCMNPSTVRSALDRARKTIRRTIT